MRDIEVFLRQCARTNNPFSLQTVRAFLQWRHARGLLVEPLHQRIDTPRGGIRPGMEEVDPQIGADNPQVGAGKDLALIGVKLLGQAPAGEGLQIKQAA